MSTPTELGLSPASALCRLFDMGYNNEDVALASYEISSVPGHDYQLICLWNDHMTPGQTFYGDSRIYLRNKVTGLLHEPSDELLIHLEGLAGDPAYLPPNPSREPRPSGRGGCQWIRIGPNWARNTDAL